jgi:hypothetical protein
VSRVTLEAEPPVADEELLAIREALAVASAFTARETRLASSRWQRVAAREAVENEPAGRRYALSPRSTRGATRA